MCFFVLFCCLFILLNCEPAPHNINLSDGDKVRILDWHNSARHATANGSVLCLGRNCPKSATLKKADLVWNSGLERLAKEYNACPFAHNPNRKAEFKAICSEPNSGCPAEYSLTASEWSLNDAVGENLLYISRRSTTPDMDGLISYMESGWFRDEAILWSPGDINNFKFNSGTGHMTQIIWENSKHVGCALQICPTETIFYRHMVVCNFWTAGNIRDRQVYKADPSNTVQNPTTTTTGNSVTTTSGNSVTTTRSGKLDCVKIDIQRYSQYGGIYVATQQEGYTDYNGYPLFSNGQHWMYHLGGSWYIYNSIPTSNYPTHFFKCLNTDDVSKCNWLYRTDLIGNTQSVCSRDQQSVNVPILPSLYTTTTPNPITTTTPNSMTTTTPNPITTTTPNPITTTTTPKSVTTTTTTPISITTTTTPISITTTTTPNPITTTTPNSMTTTTTNPITTTTENPITTTTPISKTTTTTNPITTTTTPNSKTTTTTPNPIATTTTPISMTTTTTPISITTTTANPITTTTTPMDPDNPDCFSLSFDSDSSKKYGQKTYIKITQPGYSNYNGHSVYSNYDYVIYYHAGYWVLHNTLPLNTPFGYYLYCRSEYISQCKWYNNGILQSYTINLCNSNGLPIKPHVHTFPDMFGDYLCFNINQITDSTKSFEPYALFHGHPSYYNKQHYIIYYNRWILTDTFPTTRIVIKAQCYQNNLRDCSGQWENTDAQTVSDSTQIQCPPKHLLIDNNNNL